MSGTVVHNLGNDATVTVEIREENGNKKAILVIVDGDDVMEFDLTPLRFWTKSTMKER